jgi:hypothetical protein
MRMIIFAGVIAAAGAAPAFADTLEHVIDRGIVLDLGSGVELPMTYAKDGTYVVDAFGMMLNGKWRIEADGKTLCTQTETDAVESCSIYPSGKGPGDSFEVSGPAGSAIVRINK